jgi:hypothetical protein
VNYQEAPSCQLALRGNLPENGTKTRSTLNGAGTQLMKQKTFSLASA